METLPPTMAEHWLIACGPRYRTTGLQGDSQQAAINLIAKKVADREPVVSDRLDLGGQPGTLYSTTTDRAP
jgi:hypothetical protein